MLSLKPLSVKTRLSTALVKELAIGLASSPSTAGKALKAAAYATSERRFEKRTSLPDLPEEIFNEVFSVPFLAPPGGFAADGSQALVGLNAIVGLGRLVEVKSAFEIGTYLGTTAWCLAANFPGIVVHTLDIPPEQPSELPQRVGDNHHRISHVQRVYETLPHQGVVHQLLGDSATFDFRPWHSNIDLIYVDGAHSEEYVNSDTENALKLASQGSVIVWDDVWHSVPDVERALAKITGLTIYRIRNTRLACAFPHGIPKSHDPAI